MTDTAKYKGDDGKPRTYKFKLKPYVHQVKALKKILSTGFGGGLLMEPRTGKSKVAVDYASIMHQVGYVNRVAIICPVSVIGVWEDEINKNCPWRRRITIWDKDGRKKYDLPPMGQDVLDFVIINYDAFSVSGQKGNRKSGRRWIRDQIRRWGPQLIILDESHRIKSPRAKRTRMVWGLAWKLDKSDWPKEMLAPYRLILTGTPVTKKKRVFDIYSQWRFLNPTRFKDVRTFKDFKSYFGIWVPMDGWEKWLRNKNMTELHRRIHKDSYAIKREECFDLPPRIPNQLIRVRMNDHAAEVYDQMAEEMVALLRSGEVTEASIVLVQNMRLQQITSGIAKTTPTPSHPESKLIRIDTAKLDVTKELLSDLFEAEQKVVVCARFKADLTALEELGRSMMGKRRSRGVFVIRGGQKRKVRDAEIEGFRKAESPALMVMQPSAGSLGIDLSTASTMIWYSLTSSYVDYTQSEDRIALNNIGTSFVYLIAGPVDKVMYDTLQEDGDVAKAITERPERLLRSFED